MHNLVLHSLWCAGCHGPRPAGANEALQRDIGGRAAGEKGLSGSADSASVHTFYSNCTVTLELLPSLGAFLVRFDLAIPVSGLSPLFRFSPF